MREIDAKVNYDANKKIYVALGNVAKDLDLKVMQSYQVTKELKIDSRTLALVPIIEEESSEKVEFCIGKPVAVSDEIVMPRVCIDTGYSLDKDNISSIIHKAEKFKYIHPYVRYGVLNFRAKELDWKLASKPLGRIDFIEAVGELMDHPDKLEAHLQELIEQQVSVCENLLNVVEGGAPLRSIRRVLFY